VKLRAGKYEFTFPRPALVMGIVNVTPDSFSDGGRFVDPEAAVRHALDLVAQGADILDVGGESTRPYATPVSEEEELRRVVPVIRELAARVRAPISIDTMKPGVARAALEAGACIVNDVAANREEKSMWRLVAETGAGYVCLHMRGTPQTMQTNPVYEDVAREVGAFFFDRIERLIGCGVRREQTILDPGIGFGKTVGHNLRLLGRLGEFARLERPLLLGVSRKSFLGKLAGSASLEARLAPGLACACLAIEAGVAMIRAHDVAETVRAVRAAEAILAERSS
jgi:dihydropteroate synthase